VTLTNQNLLYLVSYAFSYTFGGESYKIVRPDWLPSAYFTVTATLPPGTTKEQYRLMMENLLIDRFHMVAHHETKPLDAYELTVGKNGPKLTPSSAADTALAEQTPTGSLLTGTKDAKGYPQLARPGMQGAGVRIPGIVAIHLMARAQTLGDLARYLSGFAGAPVVDKTGLTGRYDFVLDFTPEGMRQPEADAPDRVPHIPDALAAQLGLKLEAKKIPLDAIVIDSIDRVPTGN
jgi:uncharacterized protein (TIGR03435 family)